MVYKTWNWRDEMTPIETMSSERDSELELELRRHAAARAWLDKVLDEFPAESLRLAVVVAEIMISAFEVLLGIARIVNILFDAA
jgi:hypothetical protein